jgi:hypothetical protein
VGTGSFEKTDVSPWSVTDPFPAAAWNWVVRNEQGLMNILAGAVDIVVGVAGLFSACPASIAFGIGLILVGADQLGHGIYDVATGTKNLTFLGTLAKNAALDFGGDPATAQTIGEWAPTVVSTVLTLGAQFASCFTSGTPLLTPTGCKLIEQFRVGDLILSRDEHDPSGAVEAKVVEEVFVRTGRVLYLHVGGQVIRTTPEHPFYAQGKGWVGASQLRVGDLLSSHDGRWVAVDDVLDTGEYETVYNLRIADYHTYFVGTPEWRFSVWAHNLYNPWNIFQQATRGQFANSTEAAAVWRAWSRGTFPGKLQSMTYHWLKHANGRTIAQYTADALAFFNQNRQLAQWGTWNPMWAPSFRLKIAGKGGYFTALDEILTYWD